MATQKIILFDLDGTLIDSTQAIFESFCNACETNGLVSPSLQDLKSSIGHTLEDMFLRFGAKVFDLEVLIEAYRQHYRKICLEKTRMLPNATKSLELANKLAKLGIVTTKTAFYSRKILDYFGVLGYFETIVGIEDVNFPKPHEEPILKAIERICPAALFENIFMLGDTILDVNAAKNAGVVPIALKSGYGKEEDLREICENVFEDTLEAVIAIETKFS